LKFRTDVIGLLFGLITFMVVIRNVVVAECNLEIINLKSYIYKK